jgi:preprotein translocase subunit SecD
MRNAWRTLFVIFILVVFASIIAMPKEVPVSIHWGPFNFERIITRPDVNIKTDNFSFSKSFNLVLGLDLAGGSHLVFEADTANISEDKKETAIQGVRDAIERRVNLFGVSEPNIQTSNFDGKSRIIVELPGVKDTKEAIDLIGQTAQLSFAEIGTEEAPGLIPTNLTGADIEKAEVVFDTSNAKPVVGIQFSEEGAQKFADITERNVGKPLPILLDEYPISSPVVQEKIPNGQAQIRGDFTVDEAKKLAIQINAGALPVPVTLIQEKTVGATLGSESIERSVQAGFVGLVMVMLFMILAYGRMGAIADVALIIFGILTLSLYKLIPVVLTLPGIAGFLLSVGMAVDSNILIFERFKEEKLKRNFQDALEVSFGRAWDSIRDANIATLLTAFILANPLDFEFLNTSGPVRGFAITLALGILISMFTGLVVSRNLLRVFVKGSKS